MDEEITLNGGPTIISLGSGDYVYRRDGKKKKVAVIGAGPAGLAALRNLSQAGMDVTCFEQSKMLGGIWNYNDATGLDETGTPVHAFIYRDLRTNLPKETMMFPDFPYQELEESYVHSDEVVKYLKHFASHYDLEKYIKYRHKAIHLKPLASCWSLTALDLITKQEVVDTFDSVFICSGPFATPVYPEIELARFSGHQIHSKEYRVPEPYQNKTVLIIGLGPSGLDIAYILSPIAKQIYLSTNREIIHLDVPDNVSIKPVVKSVEDKTVLFVDDSTEQIDSIIHCTGYTFNYPFLDKECEVTVNKFVFPLYKHFISIKRPTLFFIGLPRPINHLFMCDFQVRIAIKYLQGEIDLPSESEMLNELDLDIEKRKKEGQKKHNFHQLGRGIKQYFDELSNLGQFEEIPPVQIEMFTTAHTKSIKEFANFRKYTYRIIDENNFELSKKE